MNIEQLREHLREFQFNKMFEVLGWDHPTGPISNSIKIDGCQISYSRVAEIRGVPVLKFDQVISKKFNSNSERKKFHKKIKNLHYKHLVLFSNEDNFSFSYLSKDEQVRSYSYFKGQSGDYFINKLANIHFGIEDEPKIIEIGEKLEKAFNTEKVTKKFYKDFKNNHFQFQKYIKGIRTEEEKKWYSSLILNRLMFIWFLQRKGFVNNDFDYLPNKLEESKKKKKDRYYSDFLTCLFFEGFAKKPKERTPKAKKLLGEIKYLNGGLFVPHSIEEKYINKNKNKIKIQDQAFDETFKIFNKYDWCLRNTKGKPDNEISPDVTGYIFEKYINELQRKSMGAYYTRDEITSYLSRNTIRNSVLDKVFKHTGRSFDSIADLLHKLDATLCKKLLTDEDSILNILTVLDPAVGSGAFLVSAMKELMDIYSPIIEKIKNLNNRDLNIWLDDFKNKHKRISYGIKKNIILKNLYGVDIMKEATEVCKLRLFLSLVSSARKTQELEPLPNLDFNIMCGNSLIGLVNEKDIGKQLSLLKIGDQPSYTEIKKKYNKLVSQYKNKPLSFEKLKELKSSTQNFLKEHSKSLNQVLADKCKQENIQYSEVIDIQGKRKNIRKRDVQPEDFYSTETIRNLNPFHWDFAFNEIMIKGGFDVIITNPPWEKTKIEDRDFFNKYDSSIDKKKTKKEIVKRKKEQLLKKQDIKRDYLKTEEFYLFQRNYFSKLYQYQAGEIVNTGGSKKQASADMDTYRLFTERCFELLNKEGFLGIVLPSGLHKDDGAVGLRKELLFSKTKISGLIDFQNQMESSKGKIFEGVHSRYKFLLLNLQKTKSQDEFPCQFMERDLKVIDENNFPKNPKMKQSIEEIKKFSPRDYSIIEFKNPRDRQILKKVTQFPKIGEIINNTWNPIFYREFDETNDSHLFKNQRISKNDLPLYKGSAIYQYKFNHDLSYVNRYVSTKSQKVQESSGFPFKNKCYKNYRLIIRTIASNTNERSLITAVIPKNNFIAHSLNGVYIDVNGTATMLAKSDTKTKSKNQLALYSDESLKNKNKYMLLLQSFFNSFVVDYLIRQKVSSNITQNYIKPLYIPRLTEKDDYFNEIVERSAKLTCIGKEFNDLADEIGIPKGGVKDQKKRWKLQGEIDAMVAYVYDLTLDEFKYILETFTTGKNQKRLQVLKEYALEAFQKDKFPSKAS